MSNSDDEGEDIKGSTLAFKKDDVEFLELFGLNSLQ